MAASGAPVVYDPSFRKECGSLGEGLPAEHCYLLRGCPRTQKAKCVTAVDKDS